MKDKIARWYAQGLWTEAMVLQAVSKNIITQAEADEILSK